MVNLQHHKIDSIPVWSRMILLIILGYEAAGCLIGGILLSLAPDGRLMDMPVSMMHGTFMNFLIPGIILFGLGIINLLGFIRVLRRSHSDWLFVILALGGLYIWFVVEIIILHELHWLHAMWGLPVLLALMVSVPLIAYRINTTWMQTILLLCGLLSSFWYLAVNIIVPLNYEGYSVTTMTVSELSAIGAPTRILWVLLCSLYPLLFGNFGWGVLRSAGKNHALRIAGSLIIVYSIINLYWPPMHKREIIGQGNETLTDTLHLSWAMVTILLMMLIMGLGAAALGRKFRIFTVTVFIVFIVFGILIGMETPGIQANLPTPFIGVWERINIAAFILWVIVFSIILIRRKSTNDHI